jgi:transcriptional regulator with XRE-family HTH domain
MFIIVNHVSGRAHTSVGQHIRRYRAQRDLIQEQLAAPGGKKRVTIIRYELDAIDIPRSVLVAIAQGLKVRPRQLLNGDQRVPPSV